MIASTRKLKAYVKIFFFLTFLIEMTQFEITRPKKVDVKMRRENSQI